MKKFILLISLSIILGIAAFFTLNQTGVLAVVHNKCPKGPFTQIDISTSTDEDLLQIDRNGDGYICLHDNGIAIVDNDAGYVTKKKVVK